MAMGKRQMVNGTSVFVLLEKHGEAYYVVENDEELFEAAREIVLRRIKEGTISKSGMEPPKGPGFGSEDVESLPESLRDAAREKLKGYEEDLREYRDMSEMDSMIDTAIKPGAEARESYMLLQARRDHQYEGYSISRAKRPGSPDMIRIPESERLRVGLIHAMAGDEKRARAVLMGEKDPGPTLE
jgi:hypothetical protein